MAVFVTRFSWFGLLDGHHNGFAGSPPRRLRAGDLREGGGADLCVIDVDPFRREPALEPEPPRRRRRGARARPGLTPCVTRPERPTAAEASTSTGPGRTERAARADRPSPTVLPRRVRRPPRRDVPDRRDRRHAVPAAARRRGAGVAGARVRPGVAQRLRGVGALRRAVVPADRRGRLPAPRRQRRVLPAVPAGDPRALVRARRSPLRRRRRSCRTPPSGAAWSSPTS